MAVVKPRLGEKKSEKLKSGGLQSPFLFYSGPATFAGHIPSGSVVKNSPAIAGDATGSIPGWGRSPGGGQSNPLQYSCLEDPMDRGA